MKKIMVVLSVIFFGMAMNSMAQESDERTDTQAGVQQDSREQVVQNQPAFVQTQPAPVQNQGGSPAGSQNTISLDLKGMDIVDVLKILATRSGMNIVVGKNVTGRVTLFLKEVDINDALEIILLSNDLAYEKKDTIVNIMTSRDYELIHGDKFADKKQLLNMQLKYAKAATVISAINQLKSNVGRAVIDEPTNTMIVVDIPEKLAVIKDAILSLDKPFETRIFTLNYAQADKLSAKLTEAVTKGVGSIKIDERTNKITVTDYPDKLDDIAKVITAFDEKTPQVLIDAQIIEVSPSDKFEMGVDWDYWIKKHFKLTSALPLNPTGRLILGTLNTAPTEQGAYKAVLDMLRTIGDTKILSSPRIMSLNNQEAKILVGTKEAYITSSTSQTGNSTVTSQSVNFVDVGIKLYVTPTISRDSYVTMKIRPEISSAESRQITSENQITEIPIVTTSETETTVSIKDGVTIIIGGLQKDEKSKTVKKVPILGDIPLLGHLFRSQTEDVSKTELVILLTPHIMTGETPFTDMAEATPKEGVVVKMEKGDITRQKFSAAKQGASQFHSIDEYYTYVINKINRVAKDNLPVERKGEVNLNFSILSDGSLFGDPVALSATDYLLADFAVKAVKGAAPFPSFPTMMEKAKETFYVTIDYQ